MFDVIIENAGTIIVSLLLLGLVIGIAAKLRRDKKKGKSACGCSCGSCPMSSSCHQS